MVLSLVLPGGKTTRHDQTCRGAITTHKVTPTDAGVVYEVHQIPERSQNMQCTALTLHASKLAYPTDSSIETSDSQERAETMPLQDACNELNQKQRTAVRTNRTKTIKFSLPDYVSNLPSTLSTYAPSVFDVITDQEDGFVYVPEPRGLLMRNHVKQKYYISLYRHQPQPNPTLETSPVPSRRAQVMI